MEFEELRKALQDDPDKERTFEAALRAAAEEGTVGSDGEAIALAARAAGLEISVESVERAMARRGRLDDDDLKLVAGGSQSGKDEFWCMKDYNCYVGYKHDGGVDTNNVVCFWNYICWGLYHNVG